MKFVHIDKTTKNIKFEIAKKPIGAVQWDFLNSLPEDFLQQNFYKE